MNWRESSEKSRQGFTEHAIPHSSMKSKFASLALLLVFISCPLLRAEVPTGKEEFTRFVLKRFEERIHGGKFIYVAPLELKEDVPPEDSVGNVFLDRIYGYAVANPDNAAAAIDSYADRVSAVLAEQKRPISKDDVMIVVRSAETVKRSMAQLGTGAAAAYPKPLTTSLTLVPVLNSKTAVKWLGERELKKLNLSEAELFELARQNLRQLQRPLTDVSAIPVGNAVGSVREEFAPSRLLFLSDWAPVAKKLGGTLIVMVPTSDLLIYGDGSSPAKIDALRTLGLGIARQAEQPLSDTILVWTEKGWNELHR